MNDVGRFFSAEWDLGYYGVFIDATTDELVWWGASHPRGGGYYECRSLLRGDPHPVSAVAEFSPPSAELRALNDALARYYARRAETPPEALLIHHAAAGRSADVRTLLANGVALGAVGGAGARALRAAVDGGHDLAARALVDDGVVLDGAAAVESLLHEAIRARMFCLARALVARGLPIASPDSGAVAPWTIALHAWAPLGLLEMLVTADTPLDPANEVWLDRGVRKHLDMCPEIAAWACFSMGIAALPVLPALPPDARGQQISHEPRDDRDTASARRILEEAVRSGDQVALDACVTEVGADQGERATIALMLVSLAPPDVQDAFVRALVAAGARVNRTDATGATSLVKSVRRQAIGATCALLAAGADANAMDEGTPALAWAAGNGNLALVTALIEAGADPRRPDARRRTPLDHAARRGHPACASLLRRLA